MPPTRSKPIRREVHNEIPTSGNSRESGLRLAELFNRSNLRVGEKVLKVRAIESVRRRLYLHPIGELFECDPDVGVPRIQ